MEEINKYYTPEIEEFHVGFEYEYNDGREWIKTGITIWTDLQTIFILEDKCPIPLRVKHLDSQDIEELGWTKFEYVYNKEKGLKAKGSHGYSHYFKDVVLLDSKQTIVLNLQTGLIEPTVAIWWVVDNPTYVNIHNNMEKTSNEIFIGLIKNKSELKKLMKQLNIK